MFKLKSKRLPQFDKSKDSKPKNKTYIQDSFLIKIQIKQEIQIIIQQSQSSQFNIFFIP